MPGVFDKSFGQYLLALIIGLIFLILYCVLVRNTEGMEITKSVNSKWNRNKCDYVMNKTLEDELASNNIDHSSTKWDLYFPCGYDEIDKEVDMMPIVKGAKYFIIDNIDVIVAKEWLWKNVVDHYGLEKAKSFLPNSYVLYETAERNRFLEEFDNKKIYIMKKNIQRQEGLKITNSKEEIIHGDEHGYVIVQELLQNPYIIAGRKTNMRFYVLVVCYNKQINVFAHSEGFMYYTKQLFTKGSMAIEPNITTGYIERQVYVDNPLTHGDLRKYLDDESRINLLQVEKNIRMQELKISKVYFDRIYDLLRNVFITFVGKICKNQKFTDNVMFQLFGVDIAVDNNLNPMIMEINKGPDMGAKDERDSQLKHGVMRDILNIIGVVDYDANTQNKFIKILDTKDLIS